MTTSKTMTKDELIDGLLEWADGVNLSVIIVAGDGEGVNVACHGSDNRLIYSLSEAIRNNEYLRDVCAKALQLARSYKDNSKRLS